MNNKNNPVAGKKRIIVACPHGFCAGVLRAVATAEAALKKHGRGVCCLHEIVHNQMVVQDLEGKGMVFVAGAEQIPDGSIVLLSAHGVSPEVRRNVVSRARKVIDAACPFVMKVHAEVVRYAAQGYAILMIGNPRHEEVMGVVGESPGQVTVVPDERSAATVAVPEGTGIAVVMQTTLSVDDAMRVLAVLRERFPDIKTPEKMDICYATQNRQQAVRRLAGKVEYVVVLGAHNSANSNRLVAVARDTGCPASLVNALDELDRLDLSGVAVLGITAGASTPESFVESVVARLRDRGFDSVENLETAREDMAFPLPREVRD